MTLGRRGALNGRSISPELIRITEGFALAGRHAACKDDGYGADAEDEEDRVREALRRATIRHGRGALLKHAVDYEHTDDSGTIEGRP